jgi:hypothetical protein
MGRIDASTLGFIKRMATSFDRSATTTFAAALTVAVSCTSTVVALPITRWFVAMSPFASMTKPDARTAGVQSVTTLSRQCIRISAEVSTASGAASLVVSEVTAAESALAAVNPRTASRLRRCPRSASTDALSPQRDRTVRFDGVVAWRQSHVGVPS